MGRAGFDFSDMIPDYLKESTDGGDVENAVEEVALESLVPFHNHPFRVNEDSQEMDMLVDSIRDNGILVPLLARRTGEAGRYELVSGHRRLCAAEKAGLAAVPVMVREMDDAEAAAAMVHSNQYRENIPVSEKARAYRMCYEAGRHCGRKGDLDAAEAAAGGSESRRTVFRLIRISYLTDGLLRRVDEKEIGLGAAYELAFLGVQSQKTVEQVLGEYGFKISVEQAQRLRGMDADGVLIREAVVGALAESGEKVRTSLTFRKKDIAGYFPEGTTVEEMQQLIIRLLDEHAGKHAADGMQGSGKDVQAGADRTDNIRKGMGSE